MAELATSSDAAKNIAENLRARVERAAKAKVLPVGGADGPPLPKQPRRPIPAETSGHWLPLTPLRNPNQQYSRGSRNCQVCLFETRFAHISFATKMRNSDRKVKSRLEL